MAFRSQINLKDEEKQSFLQFVFLLSNLVFEENKEILIKQLKEKLSFFFGSGVQKCL
jgi:hypothetical protein